MIRTLIAGALLLLSSASAVAGAPSGNLELVDLTDEFAAFERQSSTLTGQARAEALRAHFAPLLPGFYSIERVKGGYDELIVAALDSWPKDRAGIEQVSRDFSALFSPAQSRFEAEFGPMRGYPPVYLVHSLGEFDGGIRNVAGGPKLLFGADMIARLHKGRSITPFFHHELFHLYHSRRFSGCYAIWCSLWREGLATYVSAELNPGASDSDLQLTFPVSLREAVERDRRHAICSVAAKLESSAPGDYAPLFQARPQRDAPFPPRYGYYVGYLVAQEAAKTRSLRALADMPPKDVRPLVEAAIARLADCGATSASPRRPPADPSASPNLS